MIHLSPAPCTKSSSRFSTAFWPVLALLLLLPGIGSARECMTSCGTFTFRPPYVERYQGSGPHWSVRCIYLQPAAGLHNLRTFLYRNGQNAADPLLVIVGDAGLEVGADRKDEMLDGVREQWWNTDLFASDGSFYRVSVKNQPSDVVRDIHTRHVDIGGCGTFGHYLWYVIFDYVDGPVATETPSPTPQATPTPGGPTLTPTPTPPNTVFYFPFETFFNFNGLGGAVWRMPNALPQNAFGSWPVGDGSYENLGFEENNSGRTGKASRIALLNPPVIRGGGIEFFFTGATALTPGQQYTATVWTKSDQTSPTQEYSDVILAWEPGNASTPNVQAYDAVRSRRLNEGGGWKQMSINFTSDASGDRILLAFAGNSPLMSNYGCLFDDFYITQNSGVLNTPTPSSTPAVPTNTPIIGVNTPTPSPTSIAPPSPTPTTPASSGLEDYEDAFTAGVNSDWSTWSDTWGAPDLYAQGTGRTGGSSQGVRVYYGSGGAFRQNIPVTNGKSYVLRTWIRTQKGDQTGPALGDNSVLWAEFGYDLQNRDAATLGSNPAITYWDTQPKANNMLSSGAWNQFTTPQFTATGPMISIWVKAGCTSPTGLYLSIDDWELIDLSAPTSTPTTGAATSTPSPTQTPGGPSPTATATCVSSINWFIIEDGTTNPITNGRWPESTDDGSGALNTVTANVQGQTPRGDNRYMNLTTSGAQKTKIRQEPSSFNGTGSTVRIVMRLKAGGNAGNFGFEHRDSFGYMEVGYVKNAADNDGIVKIVNGDSQSTVQMTVPNITDWHVYWFVHHTNGNVYFWLDPDFNDTTLASADLVKVDGTSTGGNRLTWGTESGNHNVNQDFDDVRWALGAHLPTEDCDIVAQPTATPTTFVSPTPTPTVTNTPTSTRTPIGKAAWKLEYSRQYGLYMTGGVAGQAELFATHENGSYADAGMTNASNPNAAIFGNTGDATNDPYTPGNSNIAFNLANRVYDFRVYNPPIFSDPSPDCYWIDGLPRHGHYRWEFWWRKVADDALYEFYPNQPVYHYDRVSGFNTGPPLPLVEAANFDSDDYGLTDWVDEHWQTFVVPQNINRITGAKAFAVRLPANKFRMTFSIHQGGVNGPQVGPSVTSREIQSDEFPNVKVAWGLEDVPVTPGGAYAMKVTYPGGFNMYASKADNYTQGQLYNGNSPVNGRDMIGVITGARRLLPDVPTATPAPATPTPTATVTPGATNTPVPTGNLDYLSLFGFAQVWQDVENETTFFETAYDFVPDGQIDVNDLFRVFDGWHDSAPTQPPAPTPTSTPTEPVAQATATPTPTQPSGSVFSFGFESFVQQILPNSRQVLIPNVLPANPFPAVPISDGTWDVQNFGESTTSQSGKSMRISLLNAPNIRGGGVEIFFTGATALVPNKQHTARVWAKSEQTIPAQEFSDLILAWEPGNSSVNNVQDYNDVRMRQTNITGWVELSITFTSNATGDRILLAFAGNSPLLNADYGAVFDDLVITQDEP